MRSRELTEGLYCCSICIGTVLEFISPVQGSLMPVIGPNWVNHLLGKHINARWAVVGPLLPLLSLWPFFGVPKAQPKAEIIRSEIKVRLKGKQRITATEVLIQINNREGDHLGQFDLPYQRGNRLIVHTAEVIDNQGKVVKSLKNRDIAARSHFEGETFHDDYMVKGFDLTWHTYPYTVRVSYEEMTERFIHLLNWWPWQPFNVPLREATISLQLPIDFEATIKADSTLEYHFTEDSKEGTHRWRLGPSKTLQACHSWSVPLDQVLPSVQVIPKYFQFGKPGSLASWQTFGQWLTDINEGLDELTPRETVIVHNLVKDQDDTLSIIETLYKYLQDNTRYINISTDLGGLIPYPASYVCHNKYGDCKALTIYMKAMLKAVGIKSYYAVVFAGSNPRDVDPDLPSSQFNHVILCVPVGQDTVWLENTSKTSPANYLGTFTQGRHALLADGPNSRLIRTPALTAEEVRSERRLDIAYDASKDANDFKLRWTSRGEEFEYLAEIIKYHAAGKQASLILPLLPIQPHHLGQMQWSQNSKASIDLHVEGTILPMGRSVAKMVLISPPQLTKLPKPMEENNGCPLRVNYPLYIVDTTVFHIDHELYRVRMAENFSISNEVGSYYQDHFYEDGAIMVIRRLHIAATRNGDAVPALNQLLESAHKSADTRITLVPQT